MTAQPNSGIQPTTFDNPMGIDGFEFVEFAAPQGQAHHLHDYFRKLGFVQVARHKTRAISTYRQGDCTFLINEDPDSFAARFAAEHGPSACGFAIRVKKLAEWARANGRRLHRPKLVLSAEQLLKRLSRPQLTLLDARGLPRFRGEVEPIDPVAGHIPGAQCAAFTDNLGADGRFLPAEQLKQRFAEKLADRSPNELVAYCGSGVTACHNLFALCLAGYPLGTLYAGSWSEWITDPQRAVATGD